MSAKNLVSLPGTYNLRRDYASFVLAACDGLSGCLGGGLTAKKQNDPMGGWIYLYRGDAKVFDCNPDYFAVHFVREKT